MDKSNRFLYINPISHNFSEFIFFFFLVPIALVWRLQGFLYKVSCYLQILKDLPLPFQFGSLLFLFLIWFQWLGLLILCSIEVVKMEILVLFLIEETLSAFHHWIWCYLWVCHELTLLSRDVLLIYTLAWEFLTLIDGEFCKNFFMHLLRWSCDFYSFCC